MYNQLHSF